MGARRLAPHLALLGPSYWHHRLQASRGLAPRSGDPRMARKRGAHASPGPATHRASAERRATGPSLRHGSAGPAWRQYPGAIGAQRITRPDDLRAAPAARADHLPSAAMSAQILDGVAVARSVRERVAEGVRELDRRRRAAAGPRDRARGRRSRLADLRQAQERADRRGGHAVVSPRARRRRRRRPSSTR